MTLWALEPADPTKASVALFPVPGHVGPYTIGRKGTHVLLENDKSISRNHATIEYGPDGLTLKDTGSTSGTFINDAPTKAVKDEPHKLQSGDRVRFGSSWRFTVAERKLTFCASTLGNAEKGELTRAAAALGASVINDWADEVTHLIMPKVSFTPKMLSAMADIKPVVTMQWVRLAMQRVALSQPLPDSSHSSVVPQQDPAQAPGASKQPIPAMAATMQTERAALFKGRHFVVLPGGTPTQNKTNEELLQKMGATLHRWPAGASAEFANQQVAAGVREFLLPEGLAAAAASQASQRAGPPLPPEAYWAARASGTIVGAESVRLCLLYTTASRLVSLEILLDEEAFAPDLEQEQAAPSPEEPSPPVATQQAARPPSLSQAPPKLPPRQQQPPPESEEPTQVEAALASGRKWRQAARPEKSPSQRGRSTARANAAAAAEPEEPEPEPEAVAATKPVAAVDDDVRREEVPSAEADEEEIETVVDANPSSVVETDVCAPPRPPPPPRVSEPAPDGWRKRGAETLHGVEDMGAMKEAPPVKVVRRIPPQDGRPAAPAASRRGGAASADAPPPPPNGKKRFVKQRVAKYTGAPLVVKAGVSISGKDKEDQEQRKQDREAADVDDEEGDPLEFDSKLASNRGGGKAGTARKRTTRR